MLKTFQTCETASTFRFPKPLKCSVPWSELQSWSPWWWFLLKLICHKVILQIYYLQISGRKPSISAFNIISVHPLFVGPTVSKRSRKPVKFCPILSSPFTTLKLSRLSHVVIPQIITMHYHYTYQWENDIQLDYLSSTGPTVSLFSII